MKNVSIGIGMMLMTLIGLSSCSKETLTDNTVSPTNQGPSKTELISGSYTVVLAVVNGDTLSSAAQWMDQTFLINSDGTGAQILYASHDSLTYEFDKPLEWEFGPNEETWTMRTKELDQNGDPVADWGDWIPFDILKLNNNEFWYGLQHPGFSMEFHLEKQ